MMIACNDGDVNDVLGKNEDYYFVSQTFQTDCSSFAW